MRISLTVRERNTNFDVTFKCGSLPASSVRICEKERCACAHKQNGTDIIIKEDVAAFG